MYAVILTGGKQYSVKAGDSIFVEKLNEADSEVTFEKVLAVGGVGIGSDDTLYALVDGRVHFERVGRDRKRCTVKQ